MNVRLGVPLPYQPRWGDLRRGEIEGGDLDALARERRCSVISSTNNQRMVREPRPGRFERARLRKREDPVLSESVDGGVFRHLLHGAPAGDAEHGNGGSRWLGPVSW
jgi:hypothetical protein